MSTGWFPSCVLCTRWHPDDPRTDMTTWYCEAFPDGIPMVIRDGTFDHTEQVADEVLLFELIDGTEEKYAEWQRQREGSLVGFSGRLVDRPHSDRPRQPPRVGRRRYQ